MGMTLKEQIMKLQTYKMYEGEDTVYVERDDILELLKQQPCEDCISREAVVKLLEKEDWADTVQGVLKLPSVAPQQTRWIPVSERLPEKDEVVLITNKWHEVDKALYIGGESFDIIINYLQKEEVIAWMPLPEPYKAESEVNNDEDSD